MVETNELLHWSSLSPMVNEIKSPGQFIKRLLYGDTETVPTNTMEISFLLGGREVAPFVRLGAPAVLVDGYGERFDVVRFPNISIKRNLEAHSVSERRVPGMPIFVPSGQMVLSGVERQVALAAQRLADMATNAEEFLAAMSLRGAYSYVTVDGETVNITIPRSGSHTIVLTDFWDTPTGKPSKDFRTAMRLFSDNIGSAVTDVILGDEATTAFLANAEVLALMDINRMNAGGMDLQQRYREDGAIFIGTFIGGIRVWSYPRSLSVGGVSTPLIRSKYAEFVSAMPSSEFRMYYGPIQDFDAFDGNSFQAQRFAKSWREKDPSSQVMLLKTRPLPLPRRPDATLSMKVVSG